MRNFFYGFFLALLITVVSAPDTHALERIVDDVLADCHTTSQVKNLPFYPGAKALGKTNNLRRETGAAAVATGEPLYIRGKVLDENCLPVANAVVEMWQANTFGKYHHPKDKTDKLRDENFFGSGISRTDNLGEFKFITIFPGKVSENKAPRVHFKIKHPDFDPLNTEMYFPERPENYTDPELADNEMRLLELTANVRNEVRDGQFKVERNEGDMVFYITYTLKGENKYKRY